MASETVYSVNNIPIRLTDEQWEHIVDEHPYMRGYREAVLDTIERPAYILRGHRGALVAVRSLGRRTVLHVAYRELGKGDGFIITAYTKPSFVRNLIIWREEDQ